jgi:hypothetical protein
MLASLLGLDKETGESLPAMLNRTTRPPPTPKESELDAELRENTERLRAQAKIDAEEMRLRIRARQIHVFENPQSTDLGRQHRINKQLAAAEAALNGETHD